MVVFSFALVPILEGDFVDRVLFFLENLGLIQPPNPQHLIR